MELRVDIDYNSSEIELCKKEGIYTRYGYELYIMENGSEISLNFRELDNVKDFAMNLLWKIARYEEEERKHRQTVRSIINALPNTREGLV